MYRLQHLYLTECPGGKQNINTEYDVFFSRGAA